MLPVAMLQKHAKLVITLEVINFAYWYIRQIHILGNSVRKCVFQSQLTLNSKSPSVLCHLRLTMDYCFWLCVKLLLCSLYLSTYKLSIKLEIMSRKEHTLSPLLGPDGECFFFAKKKVFILRMLCVLGHCNVQ